MKKLRLQVESLRVESFTPRQEPSVRGTVQAHHTDGETCHISACGTYCATNCWPYCASAETCAQTCACESKPSACFDCEM
ncbi:MAG TPA: hypothetical protein VFT45_09465 [Longimicrobium sp.]|nr:hypothetical protein [Longimicrobium sp.]